MRELILNDTVVELPAGDTNLLGWLRDRGLTAAKPGCHGGDCGACQVLVGERTTEGPGPQYLAVNSCLLTTDQVADHHVVTVEGLSAEGLTPVQRELAAAGAVQCGYCTPGLVVALTAGLLAGTSPLDAAAGNLCRCTGYAGIRRACERLVATYAGTRPTPAEAATRGLLPEAVSQAGAWLRPLAPESFGTFGAGTYGAGTYAAVATPLGGNTDEAVRHPHGLGASGHHTWLRRIPALRTIDAHDDTISIGAAVTMAELRASPVLAGAWPELAPFLDRFGSPAIRNLATVGGNLANASPVADLAVVLLAVGAHLTVDGPGGHRTLPLADFYHGYKQTDLRPGELVVEVVVPSNLERVGRLHAEKVARRTHDDIASVCSSMVVTGGDAQAFGTVALSAGGVAPVPLLLRSTAAALSGRAVEPDSVGAALDLIPGEIAPIDDIRGTARYKARLLRHLVLAHVAALYPTFDAGECLS